MEEDSAHTSTDSGIQAMGQTHREYSLCQSHRIKAVDIKASKATGIKCAQWNLLKHAKGKKQASKQTKPHFIHYDPYSKQSNWK